MAISAAWAARSANATISGDDWFVISASGVRTTNSGGGALFGTLNYASSNAFSTSFGTYTVGWSGGTPTASGTVKGGQYFYSSGGLGCYLTIAVPATAVQIKVYTTLAGSTTSAFVCTATLSAGASGSASALHTSMGDGLITIDVTAGASATLTIALDASDGGYNCLQGMSIAAAGGGGAPAKQLLTLGAG